VLSGHKYELLFRSFESNRVFAHQHPYELYRNWLRAVWAFCNAVVEPEHFRETLDVYTSEQGQEFGRLMNLYVDVVEENPFEDVLGELFMRLDVKSAAAGQYFTPGCIAEMMARMQFDPETFKQTAEEKGEVTVMDPACGSGVMLLKVGKVVADSLGREWLKYLKLFGQDIDERCVLMARLQLRFNGLDRFGRIAAMFAGGAGEPTNRQIDQKACSPASCNFPAQNIPKIIPTPAPMGQLELF
jgi:hypothetical protein